jgi:hypothetical protein
VPKPVRAAQAVQRISISSSGAQANGPSQRARISADGRFVVFESTAPDLVAGDFNVAQDVFVRDLLIGTTEIASVDDFGTLGAFGASDPAISGDGRYVLFDSPDAYDPPDPGYGDVLLRDRQLGTTRRISLAPNGGPANGDSLFPEISSDGRWAAFLTQATNLVPGADVNGPGVNGRDVIVRDLVTGANERVNVSSAGVQSDMACHGVGINADGRFVGFWTRATDLVPGDTNGKNDVFVHDRLLGTTERVSVGASGVQGNNDSLCWHVPMSADGRFVLFNSNASNLVTGDTNGFPDLFVHDRLHGATERASVSVLSQEADNASTNAAISADGRYVVFDSIATNLTPGHVPSRGIYVRDRMAGTTRRIDLGLTGAQPNASCFDADVCADGARVVFHTLASNLVPSDTNQSRDVFAVDWPLLQPAQYCTASTDSNGCSPAIGWSGIPSVSPGLPFQIELSGATPGRVAALFYSTSGPAVIPFTGGTLCLTQPTTRMPLARTGTGAACAGTLAVELNARIASGTDPALLAGARVWTQYWIRDPQMPAKFVVSNAAWFVIEL